MGRSSLAQRTCAAQELLQCYLLRSYRCMPFPACDHAWQVHQPEGVPPVPQAGQGGRQGDRDGAPPPALRWPPRTPDQEVDEPRQLALQPGEERSVLLRDELSR